MSIRNKMFFLLSTTTTCLVTACLFWPSFSAADWMDKMKSTVGVPTAAEKNEAMAEQHAAVMQQTCLKQVGTDPGKHEELVKCLEKVDQVLLEQMEALNARKEKEAAIPLAQVQASQTKLIQSFIESQQYLLKAQVFLTDALDLKSDRELLEAEVENLESGNTVDDKKSLKKLTALTQEAQEAIQKKLETGEEFSSESKLLVGKSLLPLAKSVAIAVRMVPEGSQLAMEIKSQVTSLNIFAVRKVKEALATGLFITPKLPGYLKSQTLQLRDLVKFAKKNGVDIPNEASDLI